MQAYCVKCHAKRDMKEAKAITMKNGKPATQGICSVCGTKMFRIGRSEAGIIRIRITREAGNLNCSASARMGCNLGHTVKRGRG